MKDKFCLDDHIAKHYVLKKLGKTWRGHRLNLFESYFKAEHTRERNIQEHPTFIPRDMWAAFVDYRLDPKTKVEYKLFFGRKKISWQPRFIVSLPFVFFRKCAT